MRSETGGYRRGRFRRVSRARILAGHPLKVSIYAITVMVLTFAVITSVISLLFAYFHEVHLPLVRWTLLPGMVLGYALLVLERILGWLKEYMFPQMGKLLTAFLLFFAHTIGYLAFSSIIVSYPLGYVMETLGGMSGVAGQYSLFSVNFFMVLAIFSWLRNVRTGPCCCI